MQGVETGDNRNFRNTAFLCMAWYALLGKGYALKVLEQLSFPSSWSSKVSQELTIMRNYMF